ncbi:hypothetical protein FGG08_002048 [Glutinoglossum americanum]|uniref:Cytokinesis protein sepH n=1 Tax=Glutinoglossum americanum TaxID=1670608 RepID=A0A9P8IDI9_9PEZI|nr:hypothetical protein FGG08_002048 [Glutinoglossum americanum]
MPSHAPFPSERLSNSSRQRQQSTPGTGKAERAGTGNARKDGTTQKAAQDVAGLKDYQLGDCLGKGAFGSVYRALNWGTGETVAVKQVRMADLPKSELRVIMLEIDLLKNLNHPNIVKYHGFVKNAESLYIILEYREHLSPRFSSGHGIRLTGLRYCENGSLHSICKNFGKFPENLVGLYMSQALHGLLYLHEQGVIHRDIKGANILTTKEGLVKLADFGVATRTTGLHESSVVGTPYWMAPEVIELSGATTASDIWSLGCTVIELLEGKPPYHKLQPMPALFRIVNDDHPPLPEGASPAVRDFLMQCFQKDPNLRVSARKLLKHPWIVNARRSDSVVRTQPTKYDETVKTVQEWNEALKSPSAGSGSLRRQPVRPTPSSPIPTRREYLPALATPAKGALALVKPKSGTEAFRSLEDSADDNWDDDFASSISPSALQLPHLKPQDNFGGLLSSDRLKAFATFESVTEENWDDNFESDLTVKSSLQPTETDPLQTIRPYFTPTPNAEDIRHSAPPRSPDRKQPQVLSNRHPSPRKLQPAQKKLEIPSRPPLSFRESSLEDYSDLIEANEATIEQRFAVMRRDDCLSPKLFHPSDLKSLPRSAQPPSTGGSLRRHPIASERPRKSSMRRTRSSVEIQRYAEDEGDEDFSDIFGKEDGIPEVESDSGSEHGTLMLNSKLSNNSWKLGDEDDEDDPFAQLEEGFDGMGDLDANIARDKHARLCTQVESLVSSLKTSQPDDTLAELSEQLMEILSDSPEMKSVIISAHGMLPILEILETCSRRDVIPRLLKIVNAIIFNDVEIQENLCFVGGIPIISKFASKRYSSEIRLEAAAFVRQMYQTSTLTLQMFISCGGLNVLVEFLEEDFDAERDLVLIGVNGVWSVFELQGPTPKNDFCRIFSRNSVLYPLSLVLNRVLDEEGELAELCEGRIVNIFYLFSQAENHVKEMVADRMVLKRVLKDLKRMSPAHQITMLKFIKNLSMLSTTLDSLQNSNAIEVLADLLSSSMKEPHFREISNQVLNTMYNLCRLSKVRQEDAALNGIIPLLQRIVKTERPLKEFALPILCDMAHSGKVGRKILWQNHGLQFYISLLADPYWQVTALDAIFVWLQEETAKVEEHLLDGTFTEAVVKCFTTSKANAFENLLEPLQKLLRLSPPVALSLARPDLFARILQKLSHNKAVIRLNLLRIVRSICDSGDEQGALIITYGLFDSIKRLAENDSAVLVRNMAGELVRSSLEKERANQSNATPMTGSRRRVARRASSATVTPANSSDSVPMRSTTYLGSRGEREKVNGISSPAFRPATSHGGASSSTPNFRPMSRDGISITISAVEPNSSDRSGWSHSSGKHQHRIPRVSVGARLLRTSTAPPGSQWVEEAVNGGGNGSPNPTTPVGERRRRRLWAGDGGGGGGGR